jgi:hypothetical protein
MTSTLPAPRRPSRLRLAGRVPLGFALGAQRGQRVGGFLRRHHVQREAHVHQDPVAGPGPLVEQADVDRAGHAAHLGHDQVGMAGITRHEPGRDTQAHTYPLSAGTAGAS